EVEERGAHQLDEPRRANQAPAQLHGSEFDTPADQTLGSQPPVRCRRAEDVDGAFPYWEFEAGAEGRGPCHVAAGEFQGARRALAERYVGPRDAGKSCVPAAARAHGRAQFHEDAAARIVFTVAAVEDHADTRGPVGFSQGGTVGREKEG